MESPAGYKRLRRLVAGEAMLSGMGLLTATVGLDAAILGSHRTAETLVVCGIPTALLGAVCLRHTLSKLTAGFGPHGPEDPSREPISHEVSIIDLPSRHAYNSVQHAA